MRPNEVVRQQVDLHPPTTTTTTTPWNGKRQMKKWAEQVMEKRLVHHQVKGAQRPRHQESWSGLVSVYSVLLLTWGKGGCAEISFCFLHPLKYFPVQEDYNLHSRKWRMCAVGVSLVCHSVGSLDGTIQLCTVTQTCLWANKSFTDKINSIYSSYPAVYFM